jgi:hypothetical protein
VPTGKLFTTGVVPTIWFPAFRQVCVTVPTALDTVPPVTEPFVPPKQETGVAVLVPNARAEGFVMVLFLVAVQLLKSVTTNV